MAVQPPGCHPAPYRPRRPADTPLYRTVQNHLETFLALCRDDGEEQSVSPHAERERRRYLECGILAYGFARARGDECGHDFLIAFSCQGRGLCPSCHTRRLATVRRRSTGGDRRSPADLPSAQARPRWAHPAHPLIASARGPPDWYGDSGDVSVWTEEEAVPSDPFAQPEPEYEFDQRVSG